MTRDEILSDFYGNFCDLLEKKEQSDSCERLSRAADAWDDAMNMLIAAGYLYKGVESARAALEDAEMKLYRAVQRGEVVFDPMPGLEDAKEWG